MKKKLIYISLILLIILNIFLFVNNFIEKNSTYIILDSKNIWQVLNDENIKKISKNKIKKLSYSNAKIYYKDAVDGYFGSNSSFKFYNKNLDLQQNLYDALIVIGELKVKNYTINQSSTYYDEDIKIISEFAKKNNIKYNVYTSFYKKIKISDNKQIFYVSSNGNDLTTDNEDVDEYSIIFLYEDGESKSIYLNKNIKERFSSLNKVVDIDNNSYVILLSDISGTGGNECYSLYKYDNSKKNYYPIINCEKED